jgi:hypothetical protein
VKASARLLAAFLLLSLALAVPSVAGAASASGPGGSAAKQYSQDPPPSAGGKAAKTTHKRALSKRAQNAIRHVNPAAGALLAGKVNSAAGGAPDGTTLSGNVPANANADSSVAGSILNASFRPGSGSSDRLILLLVAVVAITAALVVNAARKQRWPQRIHR